MYLFNVLQSRFSHYLKDPAVSPYSSPTRRRYLKLQHKLFCPAASEIYLWIREKISRAPSCFPLSSAGYVTVDFLSSLLRLFSVSLFSGETRPRFRVVTMTALQMGRVPESTAGDENFQQVNTQEGEGRETPMQMDGCSSGEASSFFLHKINNCPAESQK